MLNIKIFDVDRGFCTLISAGSRPSVLIDTGYNSQGKFNPARHLLQQHCESLDCLIASAYTQEHLSNLSDFLEQSLENGLSIHSWVANPSINSEVFQGLEALEQRLGNALESPHHSALEGRKISQTIKIHEIKFSFFWNHYPSIQDAQNLSLVTFISYRDLDVILPSDLRTEGWQVLLKNEEFRDRLRHVNIFVASDSGRETGYCPDLFDYCSPELILISNGSERQLSPKMLEQYQIHAKGSPEGVCDRKLLTTHDSGTITISKYLDRLRQVKTERKAYQYNR